MPKTRNHSGEDSAAPSARILVKIVPRSSRNEVMSGEGGTYKIRVTSPPVDGQANQAVIDLLAKKLQLGKESVRIISGRASRLKQILISGLSREEVSRRLEKGTVP